MCRRANSCRIDRTSSTMSSLTSAYDAIRRLIPTAVPGSLARAWYASSIASSPVVRISAGATPSDSE